MFGIQATGNSNSIRALWKPLRNAGASARAMLVAGRRAAMAGRSGRAAPTANSEVIHKASGRTARLWRSLVARGKRRPVPPKDPPLKDPKDFVLIGKPLKRLDTPDKVNGKAIYGIDAMLPGMKFATLAACPVFGGKVGQVDDAPPKNSRACARSSCSTIWSRWSAITCGRRRKASTRSPSTGTRVRTRTSTRTTSGTICARPAKRTASSPNRSATSPRAWRRATGSTPPTSCRFWRTPRWSR